MWHLRLSSASASVTLLVFLAAACDGDSAAGTDGGGGGGHDSAVDSTVPGTDGGTTSSSDGASGVDGFVIPEGRIPIFVAQGMVGRSTISCDDGHTWVGDAAWDDGTDSHLCNSTNVRCDTDGYSCDQRWSDGSCDTETPCDCGHSPGFSKGVAYAGDYFVATWGWGWPGAVRRSRNGVDWETTLDNESFGGIAYGAGRFVVSARDNYWSTDGETWTPGETADFSGPNEPIIWSVRRFAFADYDGGRFVAVASGNTDRDVLVSSDGGETWWRPSVLPDDCGSSVGTYGGIVYGNGVIAMIGQNSACRSTDGGDTWSMATFADDDIIANPIFTGTEFLAWTHYDHTMYRSTDAETWTAMPMATPTTLSAVARNPETGTLVAVTSVWSGYEDQQFLRSADGSHWDEIPDSAFVHSHPIFHIEFGYAEHSAACP